MDFPAEIVDAMETAVSARVVAGHVIAVIGKLLARREARGFADDLVALDHEAAAVGMEDHPFAPEERDGVVRRVVDRDEIDERVGLVRRQARAAVVIAEFVEAGGEARQGMGTTSHAGK